MVDSLTVGDYKHGELSPVDMGKSFEVRVYEQLKH